MKKILLLLGLVFAVTKVWAYPGQPGWRETNGSVVSQIDFYPADYANSTWNPITVTSIANGAVNVAVLQATGISRTAAVFPPSTASTNAINVSFRVPENYKANGQILVVYNMAGTADTTCALRADVETQSVNSLTSTAIVNGTAVTVGTVAAGSQLTTAILTNAATYFSNQQVGVTISRTSGTTSACNVVDVIFEYSPYALQYR